MNGNIYTMSWWLQASTSVLACVCFVLACVASTIKEGSAAFPLSTIYVSVNGMGWHPRHYAMALQQLIQPVD
jgi:hypothetical protein